MKKNKLVTGAIILSVGALLAKAFSAIYRIALTRVLGGVGIGLYQLIFPLYSLCVVLSTAGLPMAISKVVTKHKGNERAVVKKCIIFTSVISLTLSLLLILFSKGLAVVQGQPDLAICYIILAPTLILLSISSVLRGYFQGVGRFTPSAISNILEQFIKLFAGLGLSLWLLQYGLIVSIIGAMVGIVVSEVVSLIVLVLCYKREKVGLSTAFKIGFKELFKDILPITITNIIFPIATFLDSLIVVNLLSVSFTQEISVFLYGLESGAVASLVGIPTIFSFALASVVLPALSGAENNNNKDKKLTLALKIVLIICVPCAVAFVLMPDRLLALLYSNRLNSFGLDGIKISSMLLAIAGVGIVFLSLNQILSSSLQAINQRSVTIRNLIIAVMIKFVIVQTKARKNR